MKSILAMTALVGAIGQAAAAAALLCAAVSALCAQAYIDVTLNIK